MHPSEPPLRPPNPVLQRAAELGSSAARVAIEQLAVLNCSRLRTECVAMSASNEWFEYHFTPRGWESGSSKTDFNREESWGRVVAAWLSC